MPYYLSSPDIFGEKVSFLWDGDLWLASGNKTPAVRLTSGLGIVTNSKFSPDGKYIAFRVEVGEDGSSADVYTLRLADGHVRRNTYVSGRSTSRRMYTDIAGWTKNGELVITTDAYNPFGAITELYTVDPEGGSLKTLNYGPGSSILFAEDNIIIARHAIDMPHWKGYSGGTAGVLWIGKENSEFRKFVDLKEHLSSPFYLSGRVYFVTDSSGTGNLHSVNLDGGDLKQHTDFKDFYVRNAKTDGTSVVFQSGGELYRYDPKSGKYEKIEMNIISSPASNRERFVEAGKFLEDFAVDPTGDNISIVSRGRSFTTSFRNGPVVETGDSSEHIRLPRYLSDNRVVFVSDKAGEEDLYVKDLSTGQTSKVPVGQGIVEYLSCMDSGERAVFSNNRGDLFSLNALSSKTPELKKIDHSDAGIISDVSLSRDGKYVVYSFPELHQALGRGPSGVLKVHSFEEGRSVKITESGSTDFSPVFSRDDNYIFFLSTRNLDPVSDNIVFDLSFPATIVLVAVPMNNGALLKLDNIPASLLRKSGSEDGNYPIEALLEKQRVLPLRASDYEKIETTEDGVLLIEYLVEGQMKYYALNKIARKGKLLRYDPFTQKTDTLSEATTDFHVSSDGKIIVMKDGDTNLVRMDPSKPADQRDLKLDFKRFKLKISPKEEWKQMFDETKRLVRENYWSEGKINKQFTQIFKKYDHFIVRLSSRFELSDILREFQGEFRTSHSYEIGGDLCSVPSYPIGKLGIDYSFKDGRYTVTHILKANFSNEGEKSPAFLATVPLKEGDVLEAINGTKLDASTVPEKVLLNRADEIVALEINRGGKKFVSYLKTMADDKRLRYREWVETNREYVHKKTGDKVGYIHIPDMGFNGFAEFTRLYPIESKKDALLVDVRYNGGGSVSQLLLEKLAKRRMGYDKPRRGEVEPYPAYSVNGPMVCLSDENAGSDGDIFTHTFKLMNLGPVVGTRTWGGVVGIHPMHALVDGTTVTQPQFAFWFKDVGYNVENYGTDPTIEVQLSPKDWRDGVDAQLEKGLEVIDDLLKKFQERVDFKE